MYKAFLPLGYTSTYDTICAAKVSYSPLMSLALHPHEGIFAVYWPVVGSEQSGSSKLVSQDPVTRSSLNGHVGQPGIRVLLVTVMVDLHLVPARLPDVVQPSLDASPVEVEHHEEDHPDQCQHNPEEHV